jgi:hypothetical protein
MISSCSTHDNRNQINMRVSKKRELYKEKKYTHLATK